MTAREVVELLRDRPPDEPVYIAERLGDTVVFAPVLSARVHDLENMRAKRLQGVALYCFDGRATRLDGLVMEAE